MRCSISSTFSLMAACAFLLSATGVVGETCKLNVLIHGSSFKASMDGWSLETSTGVVAGYEIGKMFTDRNAGITISKVIEIDDSSNYVLRLLNGAKQPWMGGNLQILSSCGDVLLSITKTNNKVEELRNLKFTCPTRLCHQCDYVAIIPLTSSPAAQGWSLYSENRTLVVEKPPGTYAAVKKSTNITIPLRNGQTYTATLQGEWSYSGLKFRDQGNATVEDSGLADALAIKSLNGCRCLTGCTPMKKSSATYCQLADKDKCFGAKQGTEYLWDYCSEAGSVTIQGAEYLFFKTPVLWGKAAATCNAMGAELATFHDPSTLLAVWVQYHKQAGPFTEATTPFVWIGTVRNGTQYAGYSNLDQSPFDYSSFQSAAAFCADCPPTSTVGVVVGGFPTNPIWIERPVEPLSPKMSVKSLMFPPLCRRVTGQTFRARCPIPPPEPVEPTAAPGGLLGGLPGDPSSLGNLFGDSPAEAKSGNATSRGKDSSTSAGTIAWMAFAGIGGAFLLLIVAMAIWSCAKGIPFSQVWGDWREGCGFPLCCCCCFSVCYTSIFGGRATTPKKGASTPKRERTGLRGFAARLFNRGNDDDDDSPTNHDLEAHMIDRNGGSNSTRKSTPTAKEPTTPSRKEVNWSPGVVTAEYIFNERGQRTAVASPPPLRHPFQSTPGSGTRVETHQNPLATRAPTTARNASALVTAPPTSQAFVFGNGSEPRSEGSRPAAASTHSSRTSAASRQRPRPPATVYPPVPAPPRSTNALHTYPNPSASRALSPPPLEIPAFSPRTNTSVVSPTNSGRRVPSYAGGSSVTYGNPVLSPRNSVASPREVISPRDIISPRNYPSNGPSSGRSRRGDSRY